MLELAEQSGLTARLAEAVAGPAALRSSVAPGQTVSQYELLEQLGGGGMGIVFKALDRRLGRFVALKFLPSDVSLEGEQGARFLREAKVVASLDHPNVCSVLEVEELDDGQLFMVMPWYEGETLKQKIARGPLDVDEAIDYGSQVARGLAHAHAAGVVHRDIKPANIIVTPEGRAKILDFGVAKIAERGLTLAGAVLGTLSYMSPEQAAGESVDHRTDLWALGVVLYEMLARKPPFQGARLDAMLTALMHQQPASLTALRPEIPDALAATVSRLLEKHPDRRPGDAGEVANELDRLRLGISGSASGSH
jgi:serine/threonine protein kinase